MKILIRTLPLRSGNYGGILQAWALQQTLRDLGTEPFTDITSRPRNRLARTLAAVGRPTRNLFPAQWDLLPGDVRWRGDVKVREFVRAEISAVRVFRPYSKRPRSRVLDSFDKFIVGSDQVWRTAYGDVGSYLFDFLPAEDVRPRVAYAASFGSIESNDWSAQMIAEASELMGRFTALGCREQTGAQWITESMGLEASAVPDPTLLLEAERYRELIRRLGAWREAPSGAYVLTYLLDSSPELSAEVHSAASEQGASVFEVGNSGSLGLRKPRPSPAEWLHLIDNAAFMVTDSFHGMVFASLFNTPHVVIPNRSRGLDRFQALSTMLNTQGMLAPDIREIGAIAAASGRMDWAPTNERISKARSEGLGFLKRTLAL